MTDQMANEDYLPNRATPEDWDENDPETWAYDEDPPEYLPAGTSWDSLQPAPMSEDQLDHYWQLRNAGLYRKAQAYADAVVWPAGKPANGA